MKYLYQDPRTYELLRAGGWKSRARLMMASFFFHDLGNNVQKSFEGLLRSILSQILEQEGDLISLLYPICNGHATFSMRAGILAVLTPILGRYYMRERIRQGCGAGQIWRRLFDDWSGRARSRWAYLSFWMLLTNMMEGRSLSPPFFMT